VEKPVLIAHNHFFVLRRRKGCPYFIFFWQAWLGVVFWFLRLLWVADWLRRFPQADVFNF
jgi:hypothetical protein